MGTGIFQITRSAIQLGVLESDPRPRCDRETLSASNLSVSCPCSLERSLSFVQCGVRAAPQDAGAEAQRRAARAKRVGWEQPPAAERRRGRRGVRDAVPGEHIASTLAAGRAELNYSQAFDGVGAGVDEDGQAVVLLRTVCLTAAGYPPSIARHSLLQGILSPRDEQFTGT